MDKNNHQMTTEIRSLKRFPFHDFESSKCIPVCKYCFYETLLLKIHILIQAI